MSDAATPSAALGTQSIIVRPKRQIGELIAQVTLEETHDDELEISEHPLEKGAAIADHAFKRPMEVTIRCGWSNSPSIGEDGVNPSNAQSGVSGNNVDQVKAVYDQLLAYQSKVTLLDVLTGKRSYSNMLIKSLRTTTDVRSENSLLVTAVFRQVIIVTTKTLTVSAPPQNQAAPAKTNPPAQNGLKQLVPAANFNALVPQ